MRQQCVFAIVTTLLSSSALSQTEKFNVSSATAILGGGVSPMTWCDMYLNPSDPCNPPAYNTVTGGSGNFEPGDGEEYFLEFKSCCAVNPTSCTTTVASISNADMSTISSAVILSFGVSTVVPYDCGGSSGSTNGSSAVLSTVERGFVTASVKVEGIDPSFSCTGYTSEPIPQEVNITGYSEGAVTVVSSHESATRDANTPGSGYLQLWNDLLAAGSDLNVDVDMESGIGGLTAGCSDQVAVVAANISVKLTFSPYTCLADVNGDMMLSPADFSAFVALYNAGDLLADQNENGVVEPSDFSAWVANYNNATGC